MKKWVVLMVVVWFWACSPAPESSSSSSDSSASAVSSSSSSSSEPYFGTLTLYYTDGYKYTNPRVWFWLEGGAGSDLPLMGTTNLSGRTYQIFATNVTATGTYHFKFKDGVGSTATFEDSISVDSVQRAAVFSRSSSNLTLYAESYNRKVYTSLSNQLTIFSNCPWNVSQALSNNFVLPGLSKVSGGYLASVFAPRSAAVNIAGSFNSWSATANPLKFDPDQGYWWTLITNNLTSGITAYKFVLDGNTWTEDPYARSFMDDSDHNSLYMDTNYTWNDNGFVRPRRDEMVLYEVHLHDFTAGDTNITTSLQGTYQGFIEKIGYLTNLGINAVEIMPIQEWPGGWYSWGYNNCTFFAPENSLSTNGVDGSAYTALKDVVNALHQAGIAVIFDMVFNHTANDNNMLWTIDNDYYFDPAGTEWGNKIEMRNPMVQKFFKDVLYFYLKDFHADGFRFDSTKDIDGASMRAVVSEVEGAGYFDRTFIFEDFDGTHNAGLRSMNQSAGRIIASSWGTGYKNTIWTAFTGSSSDLGKVSYYSHDDGWNLPAEVVNYFSSHDEGTLWAKTTDKALWRVAATHLLTAMGIPMLWMGDEVYREHYGNTPPTGSGTDEANNVVNWPMKLTNAGLFNYYSALIRLRIAHPALRLTNANPAGTFFGWNTDWSGQFVGYTYKNVSSDQDFVVLVNYGSVQKAIDVNFPTNGTWYVMSDGVSATNSLPGLGSFTPTIPANTNIILSNITVEAKGARIYMSGITNP